MTNRTDHDTIIANALADMDAELTGLLMRHAPKLAINSSEPANTTCTWCAADLHKPAGAWDFHCASCGNPT